MAEAATGAAKVTRIDTQPARKPSGRRTWLKAMVFTAGTWPSDRRFRIGQGSGQSQNATYHPEQNESQSGRQTDYLKTKAGENTSPDHIGHHQGGGCPAAEFSFHFILSGPLPAESQLRSSLV